MAKAKGKTKRSNGELKQVEQKQAKQQKQIAKYEKNQRLMKWIAIILLILLLLALLAAGYATDWTRGLNKDSGTGTTTSGNLDSAGQPANNTGGGGSGGGSGGNGGNGSNGGGGSTSTTTNNSTTTTNTTTTNPPGGGGENTLIDELIQLYNDTGIGDNVNDLIARANSLGIDVQCTDDILIRDCTFSVDGQEFTVRTALGTGLVTGILDVVL